MLTTDVAQAEAAPDTLIETTAGLKPGTRIREHLWLEGILERREGWVLGLADDERRSETVFLVFAMSEEGIASGLSDLGGDAPLERIAYGSLLVAEVALNQQHFMRFGGRLFALKRATMGNSTLASASGQADARLADGIAFAERYRIDGVLGRGGMGEVYRAYDTILGRAVALKIVRVNGLEGSTDQHEEAKRRLLNEARVVAELEHPNIVAVYHVGEDEGLPYLALELCEGGNLRKAIAGADQAQRLKWLVEVAEGLAYAHDRGIVHRDAKPENVVITKDGIAKITDFGIAKAVRPDRAKDNWTYSVVGTPRYMAPEQLIGQRVDGRADQFAWAVMGYELLAGPLGEGERLGVDDSATMASGVPLSVRRVLARAIASKAKDRYKNFHALLTDLRASRRRRLGAILAAIVAMAIAAAVIKSSIVAHRSGAPREPVAPAVAAFDPAKLDAETVGRCAPAARADFAAGLQLWRDASRWESLPRFDAATKADPECVAASVYYLLAATQTFPRRREHFRRARELRAKLNEREGQLLEAIEPTLWEPPDFEELSRRARALLERAPTDQDLHWLYERALYRAGRFDDALAAANETTTLWAKPVPRIEHVAAILEARRGNLHAAKDRFARCLQASPDSADCLAWSGEVLAMYGECTEAEARLRRITAVAPKTQRGFGALGDVLLVSTNDENAARSAFEEQWRVHEDAFDFVPTARVERLMDETKLAIISGDLERALGFARSWNSEISVTNSAKYHGEALTELIPLLQELDFSGEARTLALKALSEHRAWLSDELIDVDIEVPRLAYLTGGIGADEYRRIRDQWRAHSHRSPGETWVAGFAALPGVGADMEPPRVVDDYRLEYVIAYPEIFSRAASELMRVGRIADAIRYADMGAGACITDSGIGYIQAQLIAAKVHDAAHDTPNACARYLFLRNLLRKNARSTTLHFAERRIRELSCKDEGTELRNPNFIPLDVDAAGKL